MTMLLLFGWCVCLQEKMSAMLAEEEEQKRLDLMMEIERLRALEAYQVGARGQPGKWLLPSCSTAAADVLCKLSASTLMTIKAA
jgi:hypothetical protein